MAWSLPSWHEPEAILELATVAVAERAGARREEVRARLAGHARAPTGSATSTCRGWTSPPRRCAGGCARGGRSTILVADAVADYIEQRRLYQ